VLVSPVGFQRGNYLRKAVNYNFKITLNEAESLNEVVVLQNSKKTTCARYLKKFGNENVKRFFIPV
jgi:hypothetical protein